MTVNTVHPIGRPDPRRAAGCSLGGAVGDALGAPVEFASLAAIRARYGPQGIRDLAPAYGVLAAITHGHPTGYLAAGFLAATVARLAAGAALRDAVAYARAALMRRPRHEECLTAVDQALRLAREAPATPETIERLGSGWVAEEALAIALFAALATEEFEAGVVLAVNHGGDSDSTGAIAGNILGTLLGPESIPARWLDHLELRDVIAHLARDLATEAAKA